ncbi:MAG: PD-(D/E)XK nuclease family protein [Streptosporangiaceae bacterium]
MAVEFTPYGASAFTALRAAVARAKAGDPLATVTVLVPTNPCGVAARRALARAGLPGTLPGARAGAEASPRGPGIAGIAVLTADRLAEQIAAPALTGTGRRPVTGAVLAAAWRQALARHPGIFAPVARHPATVTALADRHGELRELDDESLSAVAMAGTAVTASLIRLHRTVTGLLADAWYDRTDLRRTAAALLGSEPRLAAELGAVICFLPQELPASAAAMLRALPDGTLTVVAGLTGDQRADAGPLASIAALGIDPGSPAPSVPIPMATEIAHASDADDEVTSVVRAVTATLAAVPAERVAVLYGAAEPYARLLAEHLAAAGITTCGTSVRPAIARTLPRALLDLLALPDHGWRRDEVLALLTGAPVRDLNGRRVPAARWERISRVAGVVAGQDWAARLGAYAAAERASAEQERAAESPRHGLIERCERDAESAGQLSSFVIGWMDRLAEAADLGSWPELSAWAERALRELLGDIEDESGLPEEEARAAIRLRQIIAGLAGLGDVESETSLNALRLTLELELAADLPRHGRLGTGVLVAPLGWAIGLDADVVFTVGLAEGVVPARIGEDALLPEAARERSAGHLAGARARLDRQHRHLLAALAAPRSRASFPRGDLRQSRTRLPSRWLLDSLRSLSGQPDLAASEWESARGPWVTGSASFAAGLTRSPVLATEQEWRVRTVLAGLDAGRDAASALPSDAPTRRAAELIAARASDRLTRFDGNLSGQGVPDPAAAGQVVSATALETWTGCPHAYFMHYLLRVEPVESPEELIEITPLESGALIHDVLDRFFTRQRQAGAVPGPGTAWTARQREELARIAEQTAAEYANRGVTGHPVLWQREFTRILADLDALLDQDQVVRAESGRRQIRSELAFGMRGARPLRLPLPDGRAITFRGSADRVDKAGAGAGAEIVIVDYKTGSARSFTKIGESDPTLGGSKLQLPLYAHAARDAFGLAEDAPVSAEYWFLRRDRGTRTALPLTPEVNAVFGAAVATITDGIGAGLFPHRPPDSDGWGGYTPCPYCDPDGLGAAEHRAAWQRKQQDPALERYLRLIGSAAGDAAGTDDETEAP